MQSWTRVWSQVPSENRLCATINGSNSINDGGNHYYLCPCSKHSWHRKKKFISYGLKFAQKPVLPHPVELSKVQENAEKSRSYKKNKLDGEMLIDNDCAADMPR